MVLYFLELGMENKAMDQLRRPLPRIYLRRGSGEGVMDGNLLDLLEALWKVQQNNTVEDIQFETQKTRIRKHLDRLMERGCIEIIFGSHSRGRLGIARIKLLTRTLGTKQVSMPSLQKRPQDAVTQLSVPPGFVLVSEVELNALKGNPKSKAVQDTRTDENVAFVFVDAANMTGVREGKDSDGHDAGDRVFPLFQVNWRALRDLITKGPSNSPSLKIQEAFVYLWDSVRNSELGTAISYAGFTAVGHKKSDIDPLMAGDIGYFGYDAMRKHKKVTLVIVSGDGDYGHVLQRLLSLQRNSDNTSLRIWVLGWRKHIGLELKRCAHHVTHLNDIRRAIGSPQHQKPFQAQSYRSQ